METIANQVYAQFDAGRREREAAAADAEYIEELKKFEEEVAKPPRARESGVRAFSAKVADFCVEKMRLNK